MKEYGHTIFLNEADRLDTSLALWPPRADSLTSHTGTPERVDEGEGGAGMKDKEKLDSLLHTIEVVKAGYGGMLPNGNIVDRREHPDALPIAKNTLLGAPEPERIDEGEGEG